MIPVNILILWFCAFILVETEMVINSVNEYHLLGWCLTVLNKFFGH